MLSDRGKSHAPEIILQRNAFSFFNIHCITNWINGSFYNVNPSVSPIAGDSAASRFFSVQNASDCRSRYRYARHCRYADPCGQRFPFSRTIYLSAHTAWKSHPHAGFRRTSRNCCCIGLQRPSRFPKHRPAYHKVRLYPLRHGVPFSFSPDASLFRNRKRGQTSSGSHSRGI